MTTVLLDNLRFGLLILSFVFLFQLIQILLSKDAKKSRVIIFQFKMITLTRSHKFVSLSLRLRASISTELIKKQYQDQLTKNNPTALKDYPKTFQQKAIILNDPKTIQVLEVVEFGVKYKSAKNWLPLFLMALAFLGYTLNQILPIRVNDRYFMISPQSPNFISGYIFSGFNYEKPFYYYIPLMFGIHRLSRFMSLGQMTTLVVLNSFLAGFLAQYIVNKRVEQYEMWRNERICFGEGHAISLLFSFWAMLGLKDGFTHLKSRIFLETIPGLGVTRRGVPIGYVGVAYALLEGFYFYKNGKNSEIVLMEMLVGIAFGLVLRRFRPIVK